MAYKYAISFRLKNATCGGFTYGERLASLIEQIRMTKPSWEETTSFALVKSTETIENFLNRLYLKSNFSAADDLMIVIDIERAVAATKGVVEYPATLTSLLNGLGQK